MGSGGFGSGGGSDVASLKRAVREARGALRATRLRAPVAGTIAQVNGKVGASTASATAAFTTIMNPRRYTMDVSVKESDIGKLRKGQRATVTVDAVAGLELVGHVSNVGIVPDSSGTDVTYPVTITLDDATSRARVGMSARARIVIAGATGLTVPTSALRGPLVTLSTGSTLRVQTGLEGDERTIVTSGLKAGDRVKVTSASAQAGAAANPTTTPRSRQGTFR